MWDGNGMGEMGEMGERKDVWRDGVVMVEMGRGLKKYRRR